MSVTARNKLEPGDMLLACTDGLWSGLQDSDFISASRDDRTPIEQIVRKLADHAVAANAPHSDNTSVAAARWHGA
jgi:PPM family protein phosphatase